MKIRRVITGHDPAGKSVVVSDEFIDGFRSVLMPGAESHMV